MAKPKKSTPTLVMLADPSLPPEHKVEILKALASDPSAEAKATLAAYFDGYGTLDPESLCAAKVLQLQQIIKHMEEGPLRQAAFVELIPTHGNAPRHAHVVLDTGESAFPVVPDDQLGATLRTGDRVLLEGRGRALLHYASNGLRIGEEAIFERKLDERHVEVKTAADLRSVFLAAQDLMDQIHAGQVVPGATLVVSTRQGIALAALPPPDGLSHYRFLHKGGVPDVVVERDIGHPPRFIEQMAQIVHLEMTQPELRRRFKLPRCLTNLLYGVTGGGKTLAVQALHRRLYEIMSKVTDVPMDQIPPRVFRLVPSQIYSMWLGESEKNLTRFFEEVEQAADEKFLAPNGREWTLPLLVVLEEIDGVARARGQDAVYDRILTTALQQLDTTRPELRDKLIVIVATTNEPQCVDRAFFRRVGGTIERFGRLNRKACRAVLSKHLAGLPLAEHNGTPPEELRHHMTTDLTAWLFSPNGSDQGIVELTYAGSTTHEVRCRRDFLTGAMVRGAVNQAAEEAAQAASRGTNGSGITLEQLMRAFDQQVRGVADQLSEHNAHQHLDVPDGARVAHLRRIPQPTLLSIELQRKENP
jgi:ATP-dependent 26S proteasome regulatory subunit